MFLRRLFSVGSAALVLAGAILANVFLPFLQPQIQQVQAQEQVLALGNSRIGPNEAQVNPPISDKVAGLPVVILLQATQPGYWESKIQSYGSATPLVIRITEVNVKNAHLDWGAIGRNLGAVLVQTGKQDSIVVFGNELNNLDREWLSRTAPSSPAEVSPQEVIVAAQNYAQMYEAFELGVTQGAGEGARVAPAPPDMANPMYPWRDWVTPILPSYSGANTVVMNVYEKAEATIDSQISGYQELLTQGSVVKSPDFLTEVGIDPAITDLTQHVQFLNTYQPPGLGAATLVPNHCRAGGWGNGANLDDWLFYVRGQLYDKDGNLVDPGTCGKNTVVASGNPVFLYPDPNAELSNFQAELDMYLANSQAYCAPPQIFWPTYPENQSPPVVIGGNTIGPGDYPPVAVQETTSLQSLSFPLFRSDQGGVSVESDLSRVEPDQTLADAIRQNSRVDSAPQFYLSTPKTQCTSAARYLQQVRNLCIQDGFDVTDVNNPELTDCGANLSVKLINGEYKTLLQLSSNEYLPNENVCQNYSLDDLPKNTPRAQAVQAITPYTPKVFKMGFYVQHSMLSGTQDQGFWGNTMLNNMEQLVAWFTGRTLGPGIPEPQERVDVIPIWYHAGLTASEYDTNQLTPYSIDLRDYSTDASIQVKDFDPVLRTSLKNVAQQTGSEIDPRTTEVAVPLKDPSNYAGPLWQTYAFVLPQHVQDEIALRRLQVVYQNYYLLQFMRDSYFGVAHLLPRQTLADGLGSDIITKLRLDEENFWKTDQYVLPFACVVGAGGPTDPAFQACARFRETTASTVGFDGLPLSQTYAEIGSGFPEPVAISQREQLDLLKKSLVARINAGVQVTEAYQPDQVNRLSGPNSVREIGAGCQVDQANIRRGIEGTANTITSSALQPLDAPDEEPATPRTFVTDLVNNITAKVWGARSEKGDPHLTNRTTSSYLILPDEALAIETLQSYVAGMFLSPEMYQHILSGESETYPFAEEWEQLMQNADMTDAAELKLSSFLRTSGPARSVVGEEDGFILAKTVNYAPLDCEVVDGVTICQCGDRVGEGPPIWYTLAEFEALPQRTTTCQEYEEVDRRVVNVLGNQQGKTPDTGISVPGNTLALGEYLRRLAFTPAHLQKNAVYTGLEDFYRGLSEQATGKPFFAGLSDYFTTLINGISDLYKPKSGQQCNALYVSHSEAQQMAEPMLTLLQNKAFAQHMATSVFGSGKRRIFDSCGGNPSCMQFITDTLVSTPICDGQTYINPLLAYGIAMNEETNGLKEGNGWHFGCNTTAFTQYNSGAQYSGKACTTKTASGTEVINPLLVAEFSQFTNQQIVNQCVDVPGGGDADPAARRNNTPEDGFACFISVSHYLCSVGRNDAQALTAYGYIAAEGASPITPVNRIDDFTTLASRQLGKTLPDTSANREAIRLLNQYSLTLKQRLNSCGS